MALVPILYLRLPQTPALQSRLGDLAAEQPNRANSIVVGRYWIVHLIRIGVGISQRNNWYIQAASLEYRSMLFLGIYHKDRPRQPAHVFDAAQQPLQSIHLILKVLSLFLRQSLKLSTLFTILQLAQVFDTLLNGLKVREHTAEPALIDIVLSARLSRLLDGLLSLFLGSNEENAVSIGYRAHYEVMGFVQASDGL